jgi:hypothetical protein
MYNKLFEYANAAFGVSPDQGTLFIILWLTGPMLGIRSAAKSSGSETL